MIERSNAEKAISRQRALEATVRVEPVDFIQFLDNPAPGTSIMIQEIVLGLRRQDDPNKFLFVTVEEAMNRPGFHNFYYHPQLELQARSTI